jgi:hypothetical protein
VSTLLWGMLSGVVGDLIKLTGKNISGTASIAGQAYALIKFKTNGELMSEFTTDGNLVSATQITYPGEWQTATNLVPSADYEIRATRSGSGPGLSGPALDTWHSLSTERTWTLSSASAGSRTADLTISIRQASTGDVLASANIILDIDSGSL